MIKNRIQKNEIEFFFSSPMFCIDWFSTNLLQFYSNKAVVTYTLFSQEEQKKKKKKMKHTYIRIVKYLYNNKKQKKILIKKNIS